MQRYFFYIKNSSNEYPIQLFMYIYSNFSESKKCELHFIKQKSETWFNVRNTVHVTGSTANAALGLDTLKNQAGME